MSFKRFDAEDFVVSSDAITATLWSTSNPTLTAFYTSSVQEAGSSGNFYLSVYQTSSLEDTATTQFDIVYCDVFEVICGIVFLNFSTHLLHLTFLIKSSGKCFFHFFEGVLNNCV